MKHKNLPRKQKPKKRQSNKKDNFNPWITKYFDLSGCGIDNKKEEK